jgi:hypothetical protein
VTTIAKTKITRSTMEQPCSDRATDTKLKRIECIDIVVVLQAAVCCERESNLRKDNTKQITCITFKGSVGLYDSEVHCVVRNNFRDIVVLIHYLSLKCEKYIQIHPTSSKTIQYLMVSYVQTYQIHSRVSCSIDCKYLIHPF